MHITTRRKITMPSYIDRDGGRATSIGIGWVVVRAVPPDFVRPAFIFYSTGILPTQESCPSMPGLTCVDDNNEGGVQEDSKDAEEHAS
jgi:hypothetical protein